MVPPLEFKIFIDVFIDLCIIVKFAYFILAHITEVLYYIYYLKKWSLIHVVTSLDSIFFWGVRIF